MIERLSTLLQRVLPDPLAVAFVLTLVVFGAAMVRGDVGAGALVDAWVGGKGLWGLLSFSMQMCLILVTGYVLAATGPVRAALEWVSRQPQTGRQGVVVVSVGAMVLALANWGLGLVGGALLAREVDRGLRQRGAASDPGLLGAAGFCGMVVWHGGLSGSAPLKVTTIEDLTQILGPELAARVGPLPLHATVLSARNLLITAALLVVIPAVLAAMHPTGAPAPAPAPAQAQPEAAPTPSASGLAGILEGTPLLSSLIAALILVGVARWALDGGWRTLGPDMVNTIFFGLGLAFAGSPRRYMELATEGARSVAGILVQLPFYAGVMGLLAVSGLGVELASTLPGAGEGLPLATLLSAGFVNLFIPSGGAQWSVQGPIVIRAAVDAGVDPARVVMALAYGDEWTNLLQPFWALPLLGITGARAADVFGYTMVLAVVVGVVFAVGVSVG